MKIPSYPLFQFFLYIFSESKGPRHSIGVIIHTIYAHTQTLTHITKASFHSTADGGLTQSNISFKFTRRIIIIIVWLVALFFYIAFFCLHIYALCKWMAFVYFGFNIVLVWIFIFGVLFVHVIIIEQERRKINLCWTEGNSCSTIYRIWRRAISSIVIHNPHCLTQRHTQRYEPATDDGYTYSFTSSTEFIPYARQFEGWRWSGHKLSDGPLRFIFSFCKWMWI